MTSKINIGLISDYGEDCIYSNALIFNFKAVYNNIEVYQIATQIKSKSIQYIAFLLNVSITQFPKNTIFFIAFDCNLNKYKNVSVIKNKNNYIVTFNPQIANYLTTESTPMLYEIPISYFKHLTTFPELEIYKEVLNIICNTNYLETKFSSKLIDKFFTNEVVHSDIKSVIKGNIIYIDSNENLIVNISKQLFDYYQTKHKYFSIEFGRKNKIKLISANYLDNIGGDLIAIFNNWGYLEIAINEGKASSLLGMVIGNSLLIEFYDK